MIADTWLKSIISKGLLLKSDSFKSFNFNKSNIDPCNLNLTGLKLYSHLNSKSVSIENSFDKSEYFIMPFFLLEKRSIKCILIALSEVNFVNSFLKNSFKKLFIGPSMGTSSGEN